jgi:sulfate transport system permease protein
MTADTAAAIRAASEGSKAVLSSTLGHPGFALTLGVTLTILSLIVLIPLSAVALKASHCRRRSSWPWRSPSGPWRPIA